MPTLGDMRKLTERLRSDLQSLNWNWEGAVNRKKYLSNSVLSVVCWNCGN